MRAVLRKSSTQFFYSIIVDIFVWTKHLNTMPNRRDFLKDIAIASTAALAASIDTGCTDNSASQHDRTNLTSNLIVPKGNALKISGTFFDDISHDIPHQ